MYHLLYTQKSDTGQQSEMKIRKYLNLREK